MSTTIDSRLVELAFQNGQFEKGVQESLRTIKSLKSGLDFTESRKSLDALASATKNFTLGNISAGVEQISSRFSALGIVGMTMLMNLTNAAIAAGSRIARALMIDPISTGLKEYETQMNAVQTIMANTSSKGTTLDDVNAALKTLNDYSDKTIYNFTEMARNIGTFTAAGVDLDTSVSAIKGIANLAAVSGSSSQQAATGMYQLSQALASGTVRLMDWNSVNAAGMGGQIFKDSLMETARVHGVKVDEMIKKQGSFRESLTEGWLTTEILTETLSKFTGDLTKQQILSMGYTEMQAEEILKLGVLASDAATKVKTMTQLWDTLKEAATSGWAQSWQIVLGDFEEAKTLMTELSDIIGGALLKSSNDRNGLLQGWSDLGGRSRMIDSLRNSFTALRSVLTPITEAFRVFFPPATAQQLYALSAWLTLFTSKLKLTPKAVSELGRVAKGLFAILDIGRMAVLAVAKGFGQLFKSIAPTAGGFLGLVAIVGDYAVKLRNIIRNTQFFTKVINAIGTVIMIVVGTIRSLISALTTGIDSFKKSVQSNGLFGAIAEGFKGFAASLGETFMKIKGLDTAGIATFVDTVKQRFEPLLKMGAVIGGAIGKLFGGLGEIIGKVFEKLGPIFSRAVKIIGGLWMKLIDTILSSIEKIDFSKINFSGLFDGLNTGLLAGLLLTINQFVNKGTGGLSKIDGIFKSLEGLAKSADGFMGQLTTVLDGVRSSLEAWQASLRADILLKIAGAIAILAISLIALSMVDSKKLTMAIGAITVMFADLFGAMAVYEKVSTNGNFLSMGKAVLAMIGISLGLLLMSGAVVKLSEIDPEKLRMGLQTVVILIGVAMAASLILSNNSGKMAVSALGIMAFALSIGFLVAPVKKLAEIDSDKLKTGLLAVGVLLTELAVFMRITDLSGMGVMKSIGIAILAGTLMLMASAVKRFADIDQDKVQKGLLIMGLIFAEMALFAKATMGGTGILTTAISVVIISGAMLVFAEAMKRLGNLEWDQIWKGLTAVGLGLLAIGVGMSLMPPTMMLTALSLVVVSGALLVMAMALKSMSSMTWEEIGKGLATLAGSVLILALGLTAMTTALPGALALVVAAGAILMLVPALKLLAGMSLEQIGLSLLALAGVFVVLGLAGLVLTPVVPTLLLLAGAMALIGVGALAVGAGLLAFAMGLGSLALTGAAGMSALTDIIMSLIGLAPRISEALGEAFIAFFERIAEGAPKLYEAFEILILGFLQTLTNLVPEIVTIALDLITQFLTSISEHLPEIVAKGYEIIIGFLTGVRNNIGQVSTLGYEIITNFINALAFKLPELIQSGFNLMISFIDGLALAIDTNAETLIASAVNLMMSVTLALGTAIITYGGPVVEAMLTVITKVVDAVSSKTEGIIKAGKDFVLGLAKGIADNIRAAIEAALKLGKAVVDTVKKVLAIKSPSRVMIEAGMFVAKGLGNGITKFGFLASDAADGLGNNVIKTIASTLSGISDTLSSTMDFSPTITPVLDLTQVMKSSKNMNKLFGTTTIDTSVTARNAAAVSGKMSSSTSSSTVMTTPTVKPSISLTQNNYSPTGLSRLEIYRQTHNQLSALKTLLGDQ